MWYEKVELLGCARKKFPEVEPLFLRLQEVVTGLELPELVSNEYSFICCDMQKQRVLTNWCIEHDGLFNVAIVNQNYAIFLLLELP